MLVVCYSIGGAFAPWGSRRGWCLGHPWPVDIAHDTDKDHSGDPKQAQENGRACLASWLRLLFFGRASCIRAWRGRSPVRPVAASGTALSGDLRLDAINGCFETRQLVASPGGGPMRAIGLELIRRRCAGSKPVRVSCGWSHLRNGAAILIKSARRANSNDRQCGLATRAYWNHLVQSLLYRAGLPLRAVPTFRSNTHRSCRHADDADSHSLCAVCSP